MNVEDINDIEIDNHDDGKLPLGLCKRVCLKLSSALTDVYEIKADPDLTEDDQHKFDAIIEIMTSLQMEIFGVVSREIDVDSFIANDNPETVDDELLLFNDDLDIEI